MSPTSTGVQHTQAKRPGGRTARVRKAVFDATLELLAQGGYQALTIEAVASAAGVNKTTVYRNWPTKMALVVAAAEARSESLIVTETTGDVERDLFNFLRSVANNLESPLGRALVIATLTGSENGEARVAREKFWRHRFEVAGQLIRNASARRLSHADVDRLIEALIGPVYLRVFVTGAPVDDAFLRGTVRHALSGL